MECYDVIISLASNYRQKENLEEARQRLSQIFMSHYFSRELWTDPFNSTRCKEQGEKCEDSKEPARYLNQLVFGKSTHDAQNLQERLKIIENEMGRTAECRQQGIVPIDLDLMLHGHKRYHETDWARSYVKELLSNDI